MTAVSTSTSDERWKAGPRSARPRGPRAIGSLGTAARAIIGILLLVDVIAGHASGGWRPLSWLLALAVFPALLLAGQWLWAVGLPACRRRVRPATC